MLALNRRLSRRGQPFRAYNIYHAFISQTIYSFACNYIGLDYSEFFHVIKVCLEGAIHIYMQPERQKEFLTARRSPCFFHTEEKMRNISTISMYSKFLTIKISKPTSEILI